MLTDILPLGSYVVLTSNSLKFFSTAISCREALPFQYGIIVDHNPYEDCVVFAEGKTTVIRNYRLIDAETGTSYCDAVDTCFRLTISKDPIPTVTPHVQDVCLRYGVIVEKID